MNLSLDSLPITNLWENERPTFICLNFSIEEFPFYVFVKKPRDEGSLFRPTKVIHDSDLLCSCCHKQNNMYTACEPLQSRLLDVFHYLISFNHIRLQWLYREYPENEESTI